MNITRSTPLRKGIGLVFRLEFPNYTHETAHHPLHDADRAVDFRIRRQGGSGGRILLQRAHPVGKPVEFVLVGSAFIGGHAADQRPVLLGTERHGPRLPVEAHEMVAAALELEARGIGLRCHCRKRQKTGGKRDCKCLHRLILRKAWCLSVFAPTGVDIAISLGQSPHQEGQPPLNKATNGIIMTATPTLYKIVPEALWQEARQTGVFHGAGIDQKDGFIHFSTADQVKQTAALHFAGQTGLVLVAVDISNFGDKLVFEPSRGGALFPHLYADLPLSAVLWEAALPLDDAGTHIFPELAP